MRQLAHLVMVSVLAAASPRGEHGSDLCVHPVAVDQLDAAFFHVAGGDRSRRPTQLTHGASARQVNTAVKNWTLLTPNARLSAPLRPDGRQVLRGTRLVAHVAMRLIAAAAVLGLASTTALAEPPGMTPPPEPVVESYRGQPVIADGLAVIAAVTAAGAGNAGTTSTLGRIAYGTYVLGGPVIHLLHRRPGRAAISLAMRAGLPIGLGLLVSSGDQRSCSASSECYPDWGRFARFAGGFLAGALTASIVDSAVLAKGDDPPARSVSPTVTPSRGGFTLGIAGAF